MAWQWHSCETNPPIFLWLGQAIELNVLCPTPSSHSCLSFYIRGIPICSHMRMMMMMTRRRRTMTGFVQVCPDLSNMDCVVQFCLSFGCLGAPFCPARRQLRSRSQPRSAQVALKTTSSHDDNSPWAGQARCLLRVGLGRGREERSKKVQNGVTFFRLSNIPDNSRHISH